MQLLKTFSKQMNLVADSLPEPVAVVFLALAWSHIIFFAVFALIAIFGSLAFLSPIVAFGAGIYYTVKHFMDKSVDKEKELLAPAKVDKPDDEVVD